MNPFAKPMRALFRADITKDPEGVAIIAINDDEFLAVTVEGEIVIGSHSQFVIEDWELRNLADVMGS